MKKTGSIIILLLALTVIGIYSVGYIFYSNHYFIGTRVENINISNKTQDFAIKLLQTETPDYKLSIDGRETRDTITAKDIEFKYELIDENGKNILEQIMENQNNKLWFIETFKEKPPIYLSTIYNEQLLTEKLNTLTCFTENKIEPQNAYLDYNNESIEIIPEVLGNIINQENASKQIKEALDNGETKTNIEEHYTKPNIFSNDPILEKEKENMEQVIESEITIKDNYYEVVIDKDVIKGFISFDEDGNLLIEKDKVKEFVNKKMYHQFKSVGIERKINSVVSGNLTISGGTYGADIKIDEEVNKIIEELETGTITTRTPCYDRYENDTTNGGIGDTYIDIDIKKQKLYLIIDGKLDYETKCVTGLTNGERNTDKGVFYVAWKTKNWEMKAFDLTVKYWMPINDTSGQGLHDATWRSSFGGEIYKTNGSHGCINLPLDAAEYIYNNTKVHIPVIVH